MPLRPPAPAPTCPGAIARDAEAARLTASLPRGWRVRTATAQGRLLCVVESRCGRTTDAPDGTAAATWWHPAGPLAGRSYYDKDVRRDPAPGVPALQTFAPDGTVLTTLSVPPRPAPPARATATPTALRPRALSARATR